MAINIRILGRPGEDNATLLQVESGSSVELLLFDCGEKCLEGIGVSEVQSIDHLFFSHFHMDHICGFDRFFRLNYNRPDKPVTIWGPCGTTEIIHHRLRGVAWNLHQRQPGMWVVNEIDEREIRTTRFYLREAFSKAHRSGKRNYSNGCILREANYSVTAKLLNHGSIPSVGYRVDEPERENVDPAQLQALDLKPGPWIKELKDRSDSGEIDVNGETRSLADLRAQLLTKNAGESAAYLTDFIVNPGSPEWKEVTEWLAGVGTMVCEAQFRESDNELAEANCHMTAGRVGKLAADSQAGKLIMQHISRRYTAGEWGEMLAEARAIFPQCSFPETWKLPR